MRLSIETIEINLEEQTEIGTYNMQCELEGVSLLYEFEHISNGRYSSSITVKENGVEIDSEEADKISYKIVNKLMPSIGGGVFALLESRELVQDYFKDYLKNRSKMYSYRDAIYKYVMY